MPVATPAKPSGVAPDASGFYAPGQIIGGKYRLQRLIGEGGMGDVWLAQNTTLHVDVAIKLIRTEIAGSEEAAQRLLNEARAAAQIAHASIVRVHDFGSTERDDPFIVMELLQGSSLDELILRDAPLAPTDMVAMILPIISALAAAHPKGIVHRDLKPDNIFLCEDELGAVSPKLVDFGIAKVKYRTIDVDEIPVHLDVPEVRKRLATRITQMGHLVGSPEFMAPEQARGDQDIDGRADLWGVGVVLYVALSGRQPFTGDGVESILMSILTEDPAPIEGIDDELGAIVSKALRKDRDGRWRGAREMGEALARWLYARGVDEDITGRSLKGWLGSSPPRRLSVTSSGVRSLPPPTRAGGRSYTLLLAIGAILVLALIVGVVLDAGQEEDARTLPTAEPQRERSNTQPSVAPPGTATSVPTVDPSPARVRRGASASPTTPSRETVEPAAPRRRPSPPAPTRSPKVPPPPRAKSGSLPIPDDVPF